jgi:hypothetical protein
MLHGEFGDFREALVMFMAERQSLAERTGVKITKRTGDKSMEIVRALRE